MCIKYSVNKVNLLNIRYKKYVKLHLLDIPIKELY